MSDPTHAAPSAERPDEPNEPNEPTTEPNEPTASRRGLPAWLPWTLLVIAVAVAAFSTAQWLPLQADADDRAAIADVGREVLLSMTNWDATANLGETRETLRAYGTGSFPEDVDGFLGGPVAESLRSISAKSAGEVQDLFVQQVDGDEALAFGVVLQTLSTNQTLEPTGSFQYARVFLRRVDGGWLVSGVEILGADQDGQREGQG